MFQTVFLQNRFSMYLYHLLWWFAVWSWMLKAEIILGASRMCGYDSWRELRHCGEGKNVHRNAADKD